MHAGSNGLQASMHLALAQATCKANEPEIDCITTAGQLTLGKRMSKNSKARQCISGVLKGLMSCAAGSVARQTHRNWHVQALATGSLDETRCAMLWSAGHRHTRHVLLCHGSRLHTHRHRVTWTAHNEFR